MSDRAAQLRGNLLALLAALDQGPADYAPLRRGLESIVDAVFSGQDVSGDLLQIAVTQALGAYWQVASQGVAEQLILARLSQLYALALADPARVPAIEVAVPRELIAKPLRASVAPPLSYVLDDGTVVLAQDPDPAPEFPAGPTDETEPDETEPDETEPDISEPLALDAQAVELSGSVQSEASSPPKPSLAAATDPIAALVASWTLDEGAAQPVLLYRFYRDMAASAFDHLSLIARHRIERRHSESLDEEEWIVQLSDAIANIGHESLTAAKRHFIAQLDGDPVDLWGSVFFLGCVEGLPATRLLDELLGLADDAPEQAAASIADAVSKGTSPELGILLRDWAVSPVATKRAVGIAVQCRRQEIGIEAARRGLCDPSRTVRLLTLEGLRDLDVGTPDLGHALLPMLRNLWHLPDAQMAWQAVLTACWFGLGDVYRAWRRGELTTLGPYEMELIVLAGDSEDLPRLRSLVESTELNSRSLKLMARFGHPAVVPVLIHGLKDEELRDDAAEALEVLLGPRLDTDARLEPTEWIRVISTLPMRSDTRLWHGEPFRPSTFVRDLDWGRVSLLDLEQRLEEIRVRTRRTDATALHDWHAGNHGRLGRIREELRRADGQYPPGSWTTALSLAD